MKKRHTWAFVGFFCINKHLFNERSPFFIMHNCSAITKQALDLTWPTARRCNSHKKETTHLRGNVKNKNALFCYGKVPLLYMTFWGIYISFELKNSTIVRLLGFFFNFYFFFFHNCPFLFSYFYMVTLLLNWPTMHLSGQSWGSQHCNMLGVTTTLPQILAGRIYCAFIVLLDPQSQGPGLVNVLFLYNIKCNVFIIRWPVALSCLR